MEDTNNLDDNININDDGGTIHESSDIEEEDSKLHPQVQLDNNILQRLKQNDSSINSVCIYLKCEEDIIEPFFNSVDWKKDGDCISDNTKLKKLQIYYDLERNYMLGEGGQYLPTRQQLQDFFSCIYKNRSIKTLNLSYIQIVGEFGGGIIEGLCGHPSLTRLEIKIMESIAYCALGKVLNHPASKLEHLCISFGQLDNERFGILCDGLLGNSTMKKIDLGGNKKITSVGWRALLPVLQHPNCKLVELNLCHNEINDEGAIILGSALSGSSVKNIDLSFNQSISSRGWQTLLNHLTQNSITHLNLSHNRIDNNGLAALTSISTLKSLDICCNQLIGRAGWQSFFDSLRMRETQLEKLDLTCNGIGNEGVACLGRLLSNMSTLKTLDMNNMDGILITISPQGWQTFFNSLQDSSLDLVNLDFSNNNIDDEGLQLLVRLASRMSSLKYMNLSCNRLITPTGWQALTGYLQSPNGCALESLDLSANIINDDTLIAVTRTLVQNNTLKRLTLYECTDDDEIHLITERGWEAVSNLLCNKASIMDTYNSNHTLCDIYDLGYDVDDMNLPDDLISYLELNKNKDKVEVTRQKILQTHFSTEDGDTSKMQVLLDMELKILPSAIAWIGRPLPIGWEGVQVSGLSTMYNLTRRLPDLFDSSSPQTKSSAAKRKRSV